MHESTESVEEMMAVRTIGRPGGELQLSLEYSILIVQLLHMVRILRTQFVRYFNGRDEYRLPIANALNCGIPKKNVPD